MAELLFIIVSPFSSEEIERDVSEIFIATFDADSLSTTLVHSLALIGCVSTLVNNASRQPH